MTRRHKSKMTEPTGPTITVADYYRHLLTTPGNTERPSWEGYLAYVDRTTE